MIKCVHFQALYWTLVGASLILSSASSIGSTGVMISVEKVSSCDG